MDLVPWGLAIQGSRGIGISPFQVRVFAGLEDWGLGARFKLQAFSVFRAKVLAFSSGLARPAT